MPVILENLATVVIGLVFTGIISTISASALAAIGMANTVMNAATALFSMLTSGIYVLVARSVGAGNRKETGELVEQSFALVAWMAIPVALVLAILAPVLLRLMMATAEEQMFREAVRYFRVLMISLPFFIFYRVLSGMTKAMGTSRISMSGTVIMAISQMLLGLLFIKGLHWEELGAGLAFVGCRIVGCVLPLRFILQRRDQLTVTLRGALIPRSRVVRRVVKVGGMMTVQDSITQVGYMLVNSLSIGLGTVESIAYQVLVTLCTFVAIPQEIVIYVGMAVTGQHLGAGDIKKARQDGNKILLFGLGTTTLLGIAAFLLRYPLCGIYTSVPEAFRVSVDNFWILIPLTLAGVAVNALDPQIKAGGATKFTMTITAVAILGIRLPLSWIFARYTQLGMLGLHLANTVSLTVHALGSLIYYRTNRWIRKI